MKFFVVSDVHGYFSILMDALNEAGFDITNPNHIFVSDGDLLDRGPEARKCLEFVNNLPKDRKILIRGNHEDLLVSAIARRHFYQNDIHNGTVDTIEQLSGYKLSDDKHNLSLMMDYMKNCEEWNTYIASTVDYYETNKYIFVHGWIPNIDGKWKLDNWRVVSDTFDWQDARWYNGMSCWYNGVIEQDKTIVCGHWHTSWGHSKLHNKGVEWKEPGDTSKSKMYSEPFIDKGIIALDACTAFTNKINVKVLNINKKEFKPYL